MSTADDYARNTLTHVELESTEVASVQPSLPVVRLDFGALDCLLLFRLILQSPLRFFDIALTHSQFFFPDFSQNL